MQSKPSTQPKPETSRWESSSAHVRRAEIETMTNSDFPRHLKLRSEKPGWRFPAVEGKIGNTCVSGTGRHCHGFNLSAAAGTKLPPRATSTTAATPASGP